MGSCFGSDLQSPAKVASINVDLGMTVIRCIIEVDANVQYIAT